MSNSIKVFAVYGPSGSLIKVEADAWTDEAGQSELARDTKGTLRTFNVRPFNWVPSVPRVL